MELMSAFVILKERADVNLPLKKEAGCVCSLWDFLGYDHRFHIFKVSPPLPSFFAPSFPPSLPPFPPSFLLSLDISDI